MAQMEAAPDPPQLDKDAPEGCRALTPAFTTTHGGVQWVKDALEGCQALTPAFTTTHGGEQW